MTERGVTSSEAGQAFIEFLAMDLFMIFFIGGLLVGSYLLFLDIWVDYQAYQGTLCLAKDVPEDTCKERLLHRLSLGLIATKITHLQLGRDTHLAQVQLKLSFLQKQFHVKKSLQLPLRVRP